MTQHVLFSWGRPQVADPVFQSTVDTLLVSPACSAGFGEYLSLSRDKERNQRKRALSFRFRDAGLPSHSRDSTGPVIRAIPGPDDLNPPSGWIHPRPGITRLHSKGQGWQPAGFNFPVERPRRAGRLARNGHDAHSKAVGSGRPIGPAPPSPVTPRAARWARSSGCPFFSPCFLWASKENRVAQACEASERK